MARQAQSRMKLLERIQGENVELDYDDPYLRCCRQSTKPLARAVSMAYAWCCSGCACALFPAQTGLPGGTDAPAAVHLRHERQLRLRERQAAL
eukprot:3179854-Rhodomonas_salina.1